MLILLDQFGSPTLIRKAGRRRLISLIRPKAPRTAERLVVEAVIQRLSSPRW